MTHHPVCPARQRPGYPECVCPPSTGRVPTLPPPPRPPRRNTFRPAASRVPGIARTRHA